MTRRGLFAYAKKAALSDAEDRTWAAFTKGQPHACRLPEDWADLYASICNLKRRIMARNGINVQALERRRRIMQHL